MLLIDFFGTSAEFNSMEKADAEKIGIDGTFCCTNIPLKRILTGTASVNDTNTFLGYIVPRQHRLVDDKPDNLAKVTKLSGPGKAAESDVTAPLKELPLMQKLKALINKNDTASNVSTIDTAEPTYVASLKEALTNVPAKATVNPPAAVGARASKPKRTGASATPSPGSALSSQQKTAARKPGTTAAPSKPPAAPADKRTQRKLGLWDEQVQTNMQNRRLGMEKPTPTASHTPFPNMAVRKEFFGVGQHHEKPKSKAVPSKSADEVRASVDRVSMTAQGTNKRTPKVPVPVSVPAQSKSKIGSRGGNTAEDAQPSQKPTRAAQTGTAKGGKRSDAAVKARKLLQVEGDRIDDEDDMYGPDGIVDAQQRRNGLGDGLDAGDLPAPAFAERRERSREPVSGDEPDMDAKSALGVSDEDVVAAFQGLFPDKADEFSDETLTGLSARYNDLDGDAPQDGDEDELEVDAGRKRVYFGRSEPLPRKAVKDGERPMRAVVYGKACEFFDFLPDDSARRALDIFNEEGFEIVGPFHVPKTMAVTCRCDQERWACESQAMQLLLQQSRVILGLGKPFVGRCH
jgi:hypothetical protein